MEDREKLYDTICRMCLSYGNSENMVSLTDNSTHDGLSCYGKSVVIFTNIPIKNDSLPNKMCSKCLFLLKQAIIFRKTCESTNEKLIKLMCKFGCKDSEFKEKLCEYIMFVDSFPEECQLKTSKRVGKIEKQSKGKTKGLVKNEFLDFDNDNFTDFDDLISHDYKEESNFTPDSDEDIDSILVNMEIVAELKPTALQLYRKRYPKKKKQLTSRTIYNRQKATKARCTEETQKRKRELHQNEELLQCKVCSKILANPDSYQAHMQRHAGGRYICEHCGRKFVTNAELKYHLACSHDIGAQYICKQCGYKAPKKYELIEHERIHTGERPYACDKCGLTFRTRYIWKKHALYHMEKTVQCQQCPRKFHVKGELMAHVNGVHERMYIYACSQCDVTYAKTGTVRRHMTEKHGIAREMQGKIRRINLGKSPSVWNSGKGRPPLHTI